MNQQIRELLERLSGYWKQLEARQRRNVIIAGVFFVLSVSLLSWFAFRPNYVVVYSNLEAGTAGEIVTKLDEMKVPYKLQGNTILVPEQQADNARVQLAMNNLPKTGKIDFGIFNQSSIVGMTDKEFDVKYMTALQGSIANTVRSIKGIDDADVHIVMPEQKMFVEQSLQDAKASVFLKLAPGAQLSQQQVLGIQQLVAGSVKSLKPENITIIDQNGNRLLEDSPGPDGQNNLVAVKNMEIRKTIESDYQKKVRNALEKMVGFGNVEVIVNADVSFDKVKSTETNYMPLQGSDRGVVRSQSDSKESTQNAPATGGAAGNGTNNVNAQTKAATGNTSSSDKSSKTTNYEIDQKVTETVGQPYKINKVSVSVLVNGENNAQQARDIQNWVTTAVGSVNGSTANPVPPDVAVMFKPFTQPVDRFSTAWYQNPWLIGGIAAGLLLVGGGAYAIARRRRKAEEAEALIPAPAVPVAAIPEEENSQQKLKKQLEKLIDKKPEEFVNLLRTWLAEE